MKNLHRKVLNGRHGVSLAVSGTFLTLMLGGFSAAQASEKPVGLLDVYQMATEHDAPLAKARLQFQADQQNLKTARALLLPQIQADGNYSVTDSRRDASDVTTKSLALTLNQILYKHDVWAGYEQVKQGLETSKYTLQNAQQDLILRTTEAYFDVLLAQQSVRLFTVKETADKRQLDRAQASAEVGLASRVDVLQAKSSYDLSRSERLNAENNLDSKMAALTKLTGHAFHDLKGLPMQVQLPKNPLSLNALEAKADQQNLAVKQAESQWMTAQQEIDVQKGGYWPTVNLQAKYTDTAYSDYSPSPSATFSNSQNSSVGITVSVPLYSGGGTTSKVSAARYNASAAKQALRDSQEQARLNVRVLVGNLKRGETLIAALREAVKSNDAFLEAAEEGYRVGLKSLLEVLTARSNQYAARNNLLESIHNQVLNSLRLESSVGDLTMDDLVVFDRLLQGTMVLTSDKEQ